MSAITMLRDYVPHKAAVAKNARSRVSATGAKETTMRSFDRDRCIRVVRAGDDLGVRQLDAVVGGFGGHSDFSAFHAPDRQLRDALQPEWTLARLDGTGAEQTVNAQPVSASSMAFSIQDQQLASSTATIDIAEQNARWQSAACASSYQTPAMEIPSKALSWPAWQRYLVAFALTVLVVAVRVALNPWLGLQQNRHLVLLPTVMLAAWLCGFRPGVVSAGLSTLALHVLWAKEPGPLRLPSLDVVMFLGFSLVICAAVGSLQAARARADAATRSLERVLEIVAHDLRNPLTAIKGLAMSIGRATPDLKPRLEKIDRAADRMDRLIGQLVESTRIGHGELTVSPRPEAAAGMVQETVDSFAIAARQQEITLEAGEVPGDALVQADRDLIIQVLGNLVGNALKFTPPGGRVTVTARQRHDAVELAVADTGRGIDARDLPHVFEQYWKSDAGGTGLGLFIAQRVVQAHRGRIWAESAPGAGTTFFFTLPSVSHEAAARPAEAERRLALDDASVGFADPTGPT